MVSCEIKKNTISIRYLYRTKTLLHLSRYRFVFIIVPCIQGIDKPLFSKGVCQQKFLQHRSHIQGQKGNPVFLLPIPGMKYIWDMKLLSVFFPELAKGGQGIVFP